jgi:hypothetical protein
MNSAEVRMKHCCSREVEKHDSLEEQKLRNRKASFRSLQVRICTDPT